MAASGLPDHTRFSALTGAFMARFFDTEITSGTNDLRASFFWLIAFLAPLGILMPWLMSFDYADVVYSGGPELLRRLSMADKALYVGLGMVASGLVGVITWSSLLLDRRDALLLGALPLRGSTIVRAKLTALTAYVGVIAVGMHLGASVSFGFVLGLGSPVSFVARGISAHLVASCLGSMCVLFSITAAQGLLMALAGPRTFARVSPALQLGVAALVLGTLLALPAISHSVVKAIGTGSSHDVWVLWTPSVWFLGVYEWILGTRDPVVRELAVSALTAVAVAVGVTVGVYPIAYRRLMVTAVEGMGHPMRASRFSRAAAWATRAVAHVPATRASIQFFLATLSRVERHRLVLALCSGAIVAFVLPAALTAVRTVVAPPALPSVLLLSTPLVAVAFLLVGLRVAASLPGDVKAGWFFSLGGIPGREGRAGLWRVMFLLGVLPPVLVFFPTAWILAGPGMAVVHSALCLGVGVFLIEALLIGFSGIPCARPWRPERANVRTWWPAYVLAFLIVTQGVPRLTLAVQQVPTHVAVAVLAIVAGALALRVIDRRRTTQRTDDDEPATPQRLNLD